jgi:ABC-type bacteriocin/lantibiotic exporter with double-glycine peptidase domain
MSVSSLIGILNNVSEIQPQFDKLGSFLELTKELSRGEECRIKTLSGDLSLEFEDVNFFYNEDEKVIDNFSHKIDFGSFVTICGKSGIGKSSLIYLLLKFYNPQSGKIKIAGSNISEISDLEIRKNIVFVNQDPLIFSTSILENITLGRPYQKKDLDKVIEICDLEEMLGSMAEGLQAFVGQRGVKISGGQKQKICIARSLLMHPKILILDEATNALDGASEMKILSNIKDFMKGKTVIFISHHDKVIEFADRAIMLQAH